LGKEVLGPADLAGTPSLESVSVKTMNENNAIHVRGQLFVHAVVVNNEVIVL